MPSPPPGMLLWLEADVGLLDASAAACADGVAVATWQDQSGNGNDATQSSSGLRPIYRASVSGKKSVQWTGTEYLTVASNSGLNPTRIGIFAVVQMASAANGYVVNKNFDGNSLPYSLNVGGNNVPSVQNGIASYNPVGGWQTSGLTTDIRGDGLFHLVGGTFDGSTLIYRLDGSTDDSASPPPNSLPSNAEPVYIGRYQSDAQSMTGYLSELLIYPSAPTGSDLTNLESYLTSKWFGGGGSSYTDSVSDSASASDSLSTVAAFHASDTEAATATDSDSARAAFQSSAADAASAGDSLSCVAAFLAISAEAANAGDSELATAAFFAALTASASLTDFSSTGGFGPLIPFWFFQRGAA